jgi:hypothetical protein
MRFLVTLLLALLAACASTPRGIDISQQQLQSALARRFPLDTRVGDLFAAKVGAPRLTLLPDENRLRLDFVFEASDRIVRSAVHGELALSFALRFEPSDASIRLANVRVERIDLQGLPERWRAQLEPIATIVGGQLLEGTVLHTFRAEDVARARGWTPGAIRVTPAGVRVELLPPAS